jgi:hypothetical protein
MNNDIRDIIINSLNDYENQSPRSQQATEGILGPSDIGFCRQKAALVTRQVQPTDKTNKWPAMVGTALHNYIESALSNAHPDWLFGSVDHTRVTATLPSGVEISGHPDIVIPEQNMVLDIKTVDGFSWVKRNGTSDSHKYQRHLYALGCIQQGIFTGPTDTPVYVGNIYFDRSGKEPEPILHIEEFDNELSHEIDAWVQDVIYAVKNGEDTARDIAPAVCERICEFYTACRGNLPTDDGGDLIEDGLTLSAIDMYVEGRTLENEGKQMKKEASYALAGINGIGNGYQVRWTTVAATKIDSYERSESTRLDVRKVKR